MVARYIVFFLGWALPGVLFVLTTDARAGNYDQEMAAMAGNVSNGLEEQGVKSVAVLDFTDLQGTTTELGRFLAEELSTNLVLSRKRFDVIDRANLNRLLDEHKLSRSGLVDPENIKRLGKVAGAHALVTGTVTPIGDKLRISARVISTETAKIVGAARGDIETTQAMKDLMRTRIVDDRGTNNRSAPALSTQQPAKGDTPRQPKLVSEDKRYRAAISSAVIDRKNNTATIVIDLTDLGTYVTCFAVTDGDTVLAIDETGATWNLKRVVGLRAIKSGMGGMRDNGATVRGGSTHRFGLVLEPPSGSGGLTLNLTIDLLYENNYCSNLHGWSPSRLSIGFDGVKLMF